MSEPDVIGAMVKSSPIKRSTDGFRFYTLSRSTARRALRAALEEAGCRGCKTLDMGYGEEAQALDCDDTPKEVLERIVAAAYPAEPPDVPGGG